MEKLYSILYFSGGISQWALILFGISILFNLFVNKERVLLTFSMVLLVAFGSFHWWNKYRLNKALTAMTCGQIKISDKLTCQAVQSNQHVDISTSEKDLDIRAEKFYRENQYQINRQVRFQIAEKCDLLFFCKYNYSRMESEFEGRKTRIETFLTDDLNKQIYFE